MTKNAEPREWLDALRTADGNVVFADGLLSDGVSCRNIPHQLVQQVPSMSCRVWGNEGMGREVNDDARDMDEVERHPLRWLRFRRWSWRRSWRRRCRRSWCRS